MQILYKLCCFSLLVWNFALLSGVLELCYEFGISFQRKRENFDCFGLLNARWIFFFFSFSSPIRVGYTIGAWMKVALSQPSYVAHSDPEQPSQVNFAAYSQFQNPVPQLC